MISGNSISRRQFAAQSITASTVILAHETVDAREHADFSLSYVFGSPMYGMTPLAEVLAEVSKTGADAIDIWPRVHANHREQMNSLGMERVEQLLDEHQVKLGMITRYDLGPHRLKEEIPVLKRFGGKLLVSGARDQGGDSVKARVRNFVESMRPHVAQAEEHGITIGIENHSGTVLSTPDAIRYFADFSDSPHLGLALAPYHLPQDARQIASLIRHLGAKNLVFFQAWQHGMGGTQKLHKDQELMQLPGRGPLDFGPILTALRDIRYAGWVEIFMHPVPRGVPIRESTAGVTGEINRARRYLQGRLPA